MEIQKIWPVDPDEMRIDYPYGLIKEGDLFHEINREYADLTERVKNTRRAENSFSLSNEQKNELEKLCGKTTSGGYFLYDDRTPPWTGKQNLNSYLKKLERWRKIIK